MCGRFTLATHPIKLAEVFDLDEPPPEIRPRYNVAPSQKVAVVARRANGQRGLRLIQWGLIPHWADSTAGNFRPINAKAETVAQLPTFRESFLHKRCLIPADGFYEWRIEGKARQPFHFRLQVGGPFAFAAIWDVWQDDAVTVASTALLTTTPNDVVRPVHNRMPVILPREAYVTWLEPNTPAEVLQSLLVPFTAEHMESVAVSKSVNSPKNDAPELLNSA